MYGFSSLAYYIVYYVARYRRAVVRKNLVNSFPEKDEKEIVRIEKAFYRHFCDNIVETVKIMSMSEEDMRNTITFSNVEPIEEDIRNGRSQMLLMSHFGNWEFIISVPRWLKDCWFCHFYKQLTNPTFDRIMRDLREKFGSHSVETHKALRFLANARKESNSLTIAFLADQSPVFPHEVHHWLDFLNQKTAFLFSSEKISKGLECSWYYTDIQKIGRGKYKVEFIKMCDNIAQETPYAMTDLYASLLEKTIRRQPEYYLWSHNRWKYSGEYEREVAEGIAK